jgi:hypothetical protein
MGKNIMFLTKEQIDRMKEQGWQTLDTKDGVAWFGGKSHKDLAKYIHSSDIEENFEDLDFLVIGYAKT